MDRTPATAAVLLASEDNKDILGHMRRAAGHFSAPTIPYSLAPRFTHRTQ